MRDLVRMRTHTPGALVRTRSCALSPRGASVRIHALMCELNVKNSSSFLVQMQLSFNSFVMMKKATV